MNAGSRIENDQLQARNVPACERSSGHQEDVGILLDGFSSPTYCTSLTSATRSGVERARGIPNEGIHARRLDPGW